MRGAEGTTNGVATIDHGAERKLLAMRFAISATAFGYLAIAWVSPSHEAEDEKIVPDIWRCGFAECHVSAFPWIHHADSAIAALHAHPVSAPIACPPSQNGSTATSPKCVVYILRIFAEFLEPYWILDGNATSGKCGNNGQRKSSLVNFPVLAKLGQYDWGNRFVPPSANPDFRVGVQLLSQRFV